MKYGKEIEYPITGLMLTKEKWIDIWLDLEKEFKTKIVSEMDISLSTDSPIKIYMQYIKIR